MSDQAPGHPHPHPDVSAVIDELALRLGVESITPTSLYGPSRLLIGAARTDRCVDVIRSFRLSRRSYQFANWASIVAAFTRPEGRPVTSRSSLSLRSTRTLDSDWWSRGVPPARGATAGTTPDGALFDEDDLAGVPGVGLWHSVLAVVASRPRIDAVRPRVLGIVDLNWPGDHWVSAHAPTGGRVSLGDEVTVAFDPGYLVDATVLALDGERALVSIIDDSHRETFPAETDWAVGLAWQGWAVYLPGEDPGASRDPYTALVPASELSARFLDSLAHTAPTHRWQELSRSLREGTLSREDVRAAWARTREEWNDGNNELRNAERGLWAMLDDDYAELQRLLAK